MAGDPKWLTLARSCVGTREVPGKEHNPLIVRWLRSLKAAWSDDETPWCGTFVAHCLSTSGFKIADRWAAARGWQDYGKTLVTPRVGCIVVFWRKSPRSGLGHVGFVVGRNVNGNLMVLGGNQGNEVSIKPFSEDRLVGFRWPDGEPLPPSGPLPVLKSDGALSDDEQ